MAMSKISKKTRWISKQLSQEQLSRLTEDGVEIDPTDFFHREPEQRTNQLFLGYYSKSGIKLAFEKYGIFDDLKKRGYQNLHLAVNIEDPYKHRLSIYSMENGKRLLLVELILRRKHFQIETPFASKISGRSFEFLFIEWLTLQDPRASFTPNRQRLPGQNFPGLRRGKIAYELLFISCKRLRLAGMMSVPEFFHNAQIYSKTFHFLNPELEGKRRAIDRDLLSEHSLAEMSWAIDLGCVTENDQPFKWFTSELLMPIDADLKNYFASEAYQNYMNAAFKKNRYSLDIGRWEAKMPEI